jgi:hypothetical protein
MRFFKPKMNHFSHFFILKMRFLAKTHFLVDRHPQGAERQKFSAPPPARRFYDPLISIYALTPFFKFQYSKYKKIPIDQLAADAVFEQAEAAKIQQKTGNRLVDMLHENGIPIGSSIRGLQQALRTQREMEKSDPAEQVILSKKTKMFKVIKINSTQVGFEPLTC